MRQLAGTLLYWSLAPAIAFWFIVFPSLQGKHPLAEPLILFFILLALGLLIRWAEMRTRNRHPRVSMWLGKLDQGIGISPVQLGFSGWDEYQLGHKQISSVVTFAITYMLIGALIDFITARGKGKSA